MEQSSDTDMGLRLFYELCEKAQQARQMPELFDCFFTQEELSALSLRVRLVQALLQADQPQRDIAKSLHVSISKITRGSNQLKKIGKSLKSLLQRVMLSV